MGPKREAILEAASTRERTSRSQNDFFCDKANKESIDGHSRGPELVLE